MTKWLATGVAGVIGLFLLLGLVLNLVDPDMQANGLVVVMYVGVIALVVTAGYRIDKWRARRRRA